MRTCTTTLALLIALILAGCHRAERASVPSEPSPREALIRDIQGYGKSVGFEETGTFSRQDPHRQAFYRCYYTGKLDLPDSYEDLKVKDGSADGCDVDVEKYDVFFYRIEAVASPKTPTTESLAAASVERLAVVVSHEEFHQQKPIRRLPVAVEEASTTLISLMTAAEYARDTHGEGSALYGNLAGEAATFLKKAETVNEFHARLHALYRDWKAGRIERAAALSEKQRLYAELEQACKAITPDPSAFNECPAVMNNAGLAFDHTYSKHYPLMYRLALSHRNDLRSLVATLQSLPAKRWSEREAVAHIEKLVKTRPNPAG